MSREDNVTSVSSEAGILSTLVYHPDYCFMADDLKPNYFSNEQNRTLYMALQELAVKNTKTIDAYMIKTVIGELRKQNPGLSGMGIKEIDDFISESDEIARHSYDEFRILVDLIKDCALRRELIGDLNACISICRDQSSKDVKEQVTDIIDRRITTYTGSEDIPMIGEVIDEIWEEIVRRQKGDNAGIPFTDFPALNEYVTLEPGELICLAAQQKDGKSLFLTNLVKDLIQRDVSVLYIDTELDEVMFMRRLLSILTGIPFSRIKNGSYSEEEEAHILSTKEWLKTRKFKHHYMPVVDAQSIAAVVRRAHHACPLQVFIVDYFKSSGELDAFGNSMAMGALINMCKNELAGKLKIAGIGACQANPDGSIAESKKIGRYVSTMLTLSTKTDKDILDDGEMCGNKRLKVTLNRNGGIHDDHDYIDVMLDGPICTMYQAKEQHHQHPSNGNVPW